MTRAKKLNKTQEKNKAGAAKYFLACIDNILAESRRITTPLGKSITRNWVTGTEQPDQILLPTTEIGGSVSIVNTLRTDTENWKDPTI